MNKPVYTAQDLIEQQAAQEYVRQKLRAKREAGTPPTLEAAIRLGLNIETGNPADERCALAHMIEPYIRDYMAQKFAAALLVTDDSATIENLWLQITGRKVGS